MGRTSWLQWVGNVRVPAALWWYGVVVSAPPSFWKQRQELTRDISWAFKPMNNSLVGRNRIKNNFSVSEASVFTASSQMQWSETWQRISRSVNPAMKVWIIVA